MCTLRVAKGKEQGARGGEGPLSRLGIHGKQRTTISPTQGSKAPKPGPQPPSKTARAGGREENVLPGDGRLAEVAGKTRPSEAKGWRGRASGRDDVTQSPSRSSEGDAQQDQRVSSIEAVRAHAWESQKLALGVTYSCQESERETTCRIPIGAAVARVRFYRGRSGVSPRAMMDLPLVRP